MLTLKLTRAQRSALECRDGGGLDPLTVKAWSGDRLAFDRADADALYVELTDAANAEDAQAELQHDRAARGASVALGALASKVLRAGQESR